MRKFHLFVSSVLIPVALAVPRLAEEQAAVIYSQNSEANGFFLKAREYAAKSDPRTGGKLANAREAIKLFKQAVAKDPLFALAYVEMSRAWLSLGYSDPDGAKNEEILPPGRAALLKALELDPRLPEAHLGLAALYYSVDFDWSRAEQEYKAALELTAGQRAYSCQLRFVPEFDGSVQGGSR